MAGDILTLYCLDTEVPRHTCNAGGVGICGRTYIHRTCTLIIFITNDTAFAHARANKPCTEQYCNREFHRLALVQGA